MARHTRKKSPTALPTVVVKFRDDTHLPYADGAEQALSEQQLAAWDELVADFPGITLLRLFSSVDPRRIEELIQRAILRDADYKPPNLLTYFRIEVPLRLEPEALAATLRAWRIIELAYVDPGPQPPPHVDPDSDPGRPSQAYLGPAPIGIDAEAVWPTAAGGGVPGGDGAGVGFVDMEQGWTLDHDDLAAANITEIAGGENKAFHGHGTAVLAVVLAVNNNLGGIGVAPAPGSARVVSEWRGGWVHNRSDAILSALGVMAFGDVLLLETHTISAGVLMPVEIQPAAFAVIRLGSALGVTIIEAAGNGGTDLDTYVDENGIAVLKRSAPGFMDSGAILVAAATSVVQHAPLKSTNHGSRIDCYAWGANIFTAGDGRSGVGKSNYTSSFGETSGAAAIIAGAALLVQAIGEANLGYRFSPLQVRALLSNPLNGTLSAVPDTDGIGVMPDLKKIVDNEVLKLTPDVYVRDFVGDSGDPHDGAISTSPDIILLQQSVPDPQGAFGEGSGTEDTNTLGSAAAAGQDNVLYVRVRNRGGSAAANVKATVYWAPVSTLVTPDLWTPVGETTIPSVPTGDLLTVSDAIVWPDAEIPGSGHYCFVGLIGSDEDPAPAPADFETWDNFRRFIRAQNNVTWRNFNVVDSTPDGGGSFVELAFLSPGAPDRARRMELEVGARLPTGARARLAVPRPLLHAMRKRPLFVESTRDGFVEFPVNPHGIRRLGPILYPRRSRSRLSLLVQIPRAQRRNAYEIWVRQLFDGQELGRVTWRLAPPR